MELGSEACASSLLAFILGLLWMAMATPVEAAAHYTYYGGRASSMSQNYKDALTKSILFFEGQRSGKLPPNQRMRWRGDSARSDGSAVNVYSVIPSPARIKQFSNLDSILASG